MENTTKELIETAVYELSRLARVMEIPERGYVRNTYNSIQRTLAQALQNEEKKGVMNYESFQTSKTREEETEAAASSREST